MRVNAMGEAGDMLFDDLEGLLREINEFCVTINKPEDIPQPLERYLSYVAKSGNTVFPWQHVRPLFRSKILQAMEQFPGELCPVNESFVMERFDLFRAAPFTIQRLTELITQPTRHYKKKEKFLRGLEKTVLVVSTVEPWSVDNDIKNGNDSTSDGEMDQTYTESSMVIMGSEEMQEGVYTSSVSMEEHNSTHTVENVLDTVTTTMVTLISEAEDISKATLQNDLISTDPIVVVDQLSSEEQEMSSENLEPEQIPTEIATTHEEPEDLLPSDSETNSAPLISDPLNPTENVLDTVTTTMVTLISEAEDQSQATPQDENLISTDSDPIAVVEQVSSEEQATALENLEREQTSTEIATTNEEEVMDVPASDIEMSSVPLVADSVLNPVVENVLENVTTTMVTLISEEQDLSLKPTPQDEKLISTDDDPVVASDQSSSEEQTLSLDGLEEEQSNTNNPLN